MASVEKYDLLVQIYDKLDGEGDNLIRTYTRNHAIAVPGDTTIEALVHIVRDRFRQFTGGCDIEILEFLNGDDASLSREALVSDHFLTKKDARGVKELYTLKVIRGAPSSDELNRRWREGTLSLGSSLDLRAVVGGAVPVQSSQTAVQSSSNTLGKRTRDAVGQSPPRLQPSVERDGEGSGSQQGQQKRRRIDSNASSPLADTARPAQQPAGSEATETNSQIANDEANEAQRRSPSLPTLARELMDSATRLKSPQINMYEPPVSTPAAVSKKRVTRLSKPGNGTRGPARLANGATKQKPGSAQTSNRLAAQASKSPTPGTTQSVSSFEQAQPDALVEDDAPMLPEYPPEVRPVEAAQQTRPSNQPSATPKGQLRAGTASGPSSLIKLANKTKLKTPNITGNKLTPVPSAAAAPATNNNTTDRKAAKGKNAERQDFRSSLWKKIEGIFSEESKANSPAASTPSRMPPPSASQAPSLMPPSSSLTTQPLTSPSPQKTSNGKMLPPRKPPSKVQVTPAKPGQKVSPLAGKQNTPGSNASVTKAMTTRGIDIESLSSGESDSGSSASDGDEIPPRPRPALHVPTIETDRRSLELSVRSPTASIKVEDASMSPVQRMKPTAVPVNPRASPLSRTVAQQAINGTNVGMVDRSGSAASERGNAKPSLARTAQSRSVSDKSTESATELDTEPSVDQSRNKGEEADEASREEDEMETDEEELSEKVGVSAEKSENGEEEEEDEEVTQAETENDEEQESKISVKRQARQDSSTESVEESDSDEEMTDLRDGPQLEGDDSNDEAVAPQPEQESDSDADDTTPQPGPLSKANEPNDKSPRPVPEHGSKPDEAKNTVHRTKPQLQEDESNDGTSRPETEQDSDENESSNETPAIQPKQVSDEESSNEVPSFQPEQTSDDETSDASPPKPAVKREPEDEELSNESDNSQPAAKPKDKSPSKKAPLPHVKQKPDSTDTDTDTDSSEDDSSSDESSQPLPKLFNTTRSLGKVQSSDRSQQDRVNTQLQSETARYESPRAEWLAAKSPFGSLMTPRNKTSTGNRGTTAGGDSDKPDGDETFQITLTTLRKQQAERRRERIEADAAAAAKARAERLRFIDDEAEDGEDDDEDEEDEDEDEDEEEEEEKEGQNDPDDSDDSDDSSSDSSIDSQVKQKSKATKTPEGKGRLKLGSSQRKKRPFGAGLRQFLGPR